MIIDYQPEFASTEFKHPDLVNQIAYDLLVDIRRQFGKPLIITDDARLPLEMPTGAAATSLHFKGQAFDLHIKDFTSRELYQLSNSVQNVANMVCRGVKSGVEVEWVYSSTDKHLHIGFFLGARSFNTFEVRAE